MKFNIDAFISSVPVLRLFAKNLALNAGIAFVIQDFLIPLYSNYIFDIVSVLLTVGILSFFYWIFIFKKKSKNYAHFSLQISLGKYIVYNKNLFLIIFFNKKGVTTTIYFWNYLLY